MSVCICVWGEVFASVKTTSWTSRVFLQSQDQYRSFMAPGKTKALGNSIQVKKNPGQRKSGVGWGVCMHLELPASKPWLCPPLWKEIQVPSLKGLIPCILCKAPQLMLINVFSTSRWVGGSGHQKGHIISWNFQPPLGRSHVVLEMELYVNT